MNKKNTLIVAGLLITLGLISRLLPHPANFAPIGAIAIFGGLYLPKRWAIILPMIAMFVSDIFIGFYAWQIMFAVYGSFAIVGLIGLFVRKNKKAATVIGGTILGSILFFLITNFAVWAFGSMYTHSLAGLIRCYTIAIPFFKNTLLGDLFYVSLLVGTFELIVRRNLLTFLKGMVYSTCGTSLLTSSIRLSPESRETTEIVPLSNIEAGNLTDFPSS